MVTSKMQNSYRGVIKCSRVDMVALSAVSLDRINENDGQHIYQAMPLLERTQIQKLHLSRMQPNLIDTTTALVTFLDGLGECKGQPPSLYIDLEGNDLSRQGTLSLVTILVEPQQKLHLIDVTTLKGQAFDTCGSDSRTLKDILESKEIIKVFFDIRNDSDALFSLYGIEIIW